ncbi:hypothetical protein [Modestobacter roseus]|nr:hypothetical protein [Modestobacter roseus]
MAAVHETARGSYYAGASTELDGVLTPAPERRAMWDVLPWAWGSGLGSQLHDAFTTRLTSGPARLGVLEVWRGNGRALDSHAHRGWRRDDRTRPGPDGSPYVGMTRAADSTTGRGDSSSSRTTAG